MFSDAAGLKGLNSKDNIRVDGDTAAMEHTGDASLRSVGGAVAAVDLVFERQKESGKFTLRLVKMTTVILTFLHFFLCLSRSIYVLYTFIFYFLCLPYSFSPVNLD
jgi:hypothetical protein